MIFLIIFAILIALNIWAQARVSRALGPCFQRTMINMSIWVVPFIGAFFSQIGLPKAPRDTVTVPAAMLPPGFLKNDVPDSIVLPGITPFSVNEYLLTIHNVPILDWKAFAAWQTEIADPAQQRHATVMGHRAWLCYLKDAIGSHCYLYETDTAFIISSLEPNVIMASAEFIATTRKRINHLLPDVARFPEETKSILIVLDNEDTYYQYVSIYYPDNGDFALSGGMFINAGCPHFVTLRRDLTATEPVITHKLTHSALNYLGLPLWLDEGIAVNSEHRLCPRQSRLGEPREMHARHLRFWNTERIQEFWSGHSFSRQDDGNLLSYDLARILVEYFSRDWAAFARFVLAAKRGDAGRSAARDTLAVDLGQSVCSLFGFEVTPEWSPPMQAQ